MEGLYGAIVFGKLQGRIQTFEEIGRNYSGRYGTHMVHLRKPLLEWAGNDLLKISMKISQTRRGAVIQTRCWHNGTSFTKTRLSRRSLLAQSRWGPALACL